MSSQVSKILSRFERKLSSSPSFIKTLDFVENPVCSSPKKSQIPQNSSPAFQTLKTLYQDSIVKYFKSESPRSMTPDNNSVPALTQEYRSVTPSSTSTSTRSQKALPLFQPKLNKNSVKIASKLGNPRERLLTPNATQVIEEELFSYKPKINKKSQKIDKNKNETDHRWNTLYAQGKEKRIERERIRMEIEMHERKKEACTFKPQILQPSFAIDSHKTIERLENWAKGKNQKLKEKKDKEIDKDMQECTFAPRLIEPQHSTKSLSNIKGVSKYVERGQRIKTDKSQDLLQVSSNPQKDLNKKKFFELQLALHDELFSLEL